MNSQKTILVALATVVIFAAGVVTGGLLVHQTRPRAAPIGGIPFLGRVEAMSRTANQLDLSPDQRRRITEIVRNGRERLADYFLILEPDIHQMFREMRQQIQAELTPAQRAEFDELFRKRQQRPADRRPANSSPSRSTNSPSSPAN